jgi:hypothetical protein
LVVSSKTADELLMVHDWALGQELAPLRPRTAHVLALAQAIRVCPSNGTSSPRKVTGSFEEVQL